MHGVGRTSITATQFAAESTDAATLTLDYAAVAIAGLALAFTCVIGVLNRRTATRALELSERQEARRNSELDLYLIAVTSRRRETDGDRVLEFHVQVTNPADRASSVVAAELHVTYSVASGVMTTVKFPHAVDTADDLATPGVSPLQLPARLDANDALAGWLRFRLGGEMMLGREIDRYDLVIRDVHGIEEALQVRVMSDVTA